MNRDLPRAESTLAIVLGASEFPKAGDLSPSPSFKHSAEAFRDYLEDKDGLGLSSSNLLYLFDSPMSGPDLDEEVVRFLKGHASSGVHGGAQPTDVIVYYVGHGGFGSSGADYYLALRATRADNPVMSSYSVQALASTLKRHAAHLRRYVILDSCFSAASYSEFQSGPLEVAVQQTKAVLPLKGTALLCASGPRNPARAPQGARFTMFSGALLQSLREGVDRDFLHYTIEQLAEAVETRIRETYNDEAVRPEVHFPSQPEGGLGRIPLFPNPQRSHRSLQLKLNALELHVALTTSGLAEVREQHATMMSQLRQVRSEIDAMLKAPVPQIAPEAAGVGDSPERWKHIGGQRITLLEWSNLPGEVKAIMMRAHRARQQGFAWLTFCTAATVANFVVCFYPFAANRLSMRVGLLIVALLSLINMVGVVRDIWANLPYGFKRDGYLIDDGWWDKLEAVVALGTVHTVSVFPGFRTTGAMLYSATIVCLVGLIASFSGYYDANLFFSR